ncbi:acid phosphatase [Mycoplasmopsis caviae]|uniref:5'-nucleotidase, lipoprotein e(P4) family n=1 Tax=Mycoplasmopsis caviae TaxID=55603 RepID=A0A3P8MF61_9BACT|nr:HAD family acid phosphatase [Mycoplasmopsis caviae]UUD35526.1 acid phosphatase [Mycoplasmopsis caviae]VDR41703.1 5'-nucleotidase, lipoprotein e(P4) family [Mycoplasmopsis caviae]
MKRKFLFSSLAPLVALSPITIAASCEKDKQENFDFNKLTPAEKNKFIKEEFAKLNDEGKKALINSIDYKSILSMDEKEALISKLNKDAAQFGSIVWYIKSVEARIAKEAEYARATAVFDNLMTRATTDKFEYNQDFNTKQQVDNASNGNYIPVVFMDIDETVLQNDYTEVYGMLNGGYSGKMKEKNDLQAKRFAVPGAVKFINHVQSKGALVVYNSDMNQSTAVRDALKKNLKNLGIKYVADFQFWMRGSMPYVAVDGTTIISDEMTKNMSKDELKELANKMTFKSDFEATPWRTWTNSSAAEILGKKVYKTDRMNGLDDNDKGWNLSSIDSKSGNAVKLRTLMRIGDNFNDFFDRNSKGKNNGERTNQYLKTEGMRELFTNIKGAEGLKYVKKADGKYGEFKKQTYWQGYSMIPGNSEYGGWLEEFGYGDTYNMIYQELKSILADPRYQSERSESDPNNEKQD